MALTLLPLSTARPIASSLRASNASSIRCSLTVPCAVPVSLSSSSSPSSSSSSFLFSPLVSSFAGLSLSGISFIFGTDNSKTGPKRDVIVAAKKFQLGQTKRHKNKMCLARVHGFFARMSSAGGRKVLKRRRAKGRHILCTKTHASTGKRHVPAHGKGKRRRRR